MFGRFFKLRKELTIYKSEKSLLKKLVSSQKDLCIFLSGKWGVGKTTLVKEVLSKKRNSIYISLYPITSLDELKKQIFSKTATPLNIFLSNYSSFFKKNPIPILFNTEFLIETSLSKISRKIFVFDDLERSKINKQVFLGLIEKLKQQHNIIILISNIEYLDPKFKKSLEKVVDHYIELSIPINKYKDIISYFFKECTTCEKVFFILFFGKNINLRIIKQIANLCCKLEKFSRNFLKQKKIDRNEIEDIIFNIINQSLPILFIHIKYGFSLTEINDWIEFIKSKKVDSQDLTQNKLSKNLKNDLSEKELYEIETLLSGVKNLPEWLKKFLRMKEIPKKDLEEVLKEKISYKSRELLKLLLKSKNLKSFFKEEESLKLLEHILYKKISNNDGFIDFVKEINPKLYNKFCNKLIDFKKTLQNLRISDKITLLYQLKFCPETINFYCKDNTSKIKKIIESIERDIKKTLEKDIDAILELLKIWPIRSYIHYNLSYKCHYSHLDEKNLDMFQENIRNMLLDIPISFDEEEIISFFIKLHSVQYKIDKELYEEFYEKLANKYSILKEIRRLEEEKGINLINILINLQF